MAVAPTDLEISAAQFAELTSLDALARFFTRLGYPTDARSSLTAEAIGLAGEAAAPIRGIELLAADEDGFLRVVVVHLKSMTAKSRNDLARVLGRTNVDHLLVLTANFATLEFVLLHKRRRESRGPAGGQRIQVVPLVFAVDRKDVGTKELRTIRRFTWTSRDGLEQFDKLRSVFEAAAFTEDYFCNRALFADHYLLTRLREDPAWGQSPSDPFRTTRELLHDARQRWRDKEEQIVRDELYEPVFELLGFQAKRNKGADEDQTTPDMSLAEQTWHVLATWLLQLLTVQALIAAGKAPVSWSAAKARNAARALLRRALTDRSCHRTQTFRRRLQAATLDPPRSGRKQTRHWPRKKQEAPPGPPQLQPATPPQRQRAQQLRATMNLNS